MKPLSRRGQTFALLAFTLLLLLVILLLGPLLTEQAAETDLAQKLLPPSLLHPFGTDHLGRDMLSRTLSGLALSLGIGLLAAGISALIALALGLASATLGRRVAAAAGFVIDLVMGVPHILLLLLLSLAFGRGFLGVVLAVSLTHWPTLARLLRGEVLQLRGQTYVRAVEQLGIGRLRIALRHFLPHLLPQFLAGAVLTLPHAVLHESALTFLGFGLSPDVPAIGIILSESMGYLVAGKWWLALFPGALLVASVALCSAAGEGLRRLTDPASLHA